MKKIFFCITLLLAFCGITNSFAAKIKGLNGSDKVQSVASVLQVALRQSDVPNAATDVLDFIDETTDETDDSEEDNNAFSTPNFHNFNQVSDRFYPFLNTKKSCNIHSFCLTLPIFILLQVFRL